MRGLSVRSGRICEDPAVAMQQALGGQHQAAARPKVGGGEDLVLWVRSPVVAAAARYIVFRRNVNSLPHLSRRKGAEAAVCCLR